MTVEIGSPAWKQLILAGARQLGLTLQEPIAELFALHARELLKWNRKINLTAITDPLEMAVKHYLDSIAAVGILPRPTNLLDIGSGGGFPGIPLKIVMPDLPVTLIDASRKKAGFLQHAGRLLGFENFQAIHARAEDLLRTANDRDDRPKEDCGAGFHGLPDSFSLIVTRALASLDGFLSLGLPMLSAGGMMVAFKGRMPEEEIDHGRVSRAGLSVTIHRYELPFLHYERSLVLFETSASEPNGTAGPMAG